LTVTAPTPVASDIPLCTSNKPEVASKIQKHLKAVQAASLLKNEVVKEFVTSRRNCW
jgi:hypothetical protein